MAARGWVAEAWPGLCAVLVGVGLGRFAYTPTLPSLVSHGWLAPNEAAYVGAANLAGYLAGALVRDGGRAGGGTGRDRAGRRKAGRARRGDPLRRLRRRRGGVRPALALLGRLHRARARLRHGARHRELAALRPRRGGGTAR